MFFGNKKYELIDEDAREYFKFFEKYTTSVFMNIKSLAHESGKNEDLGEDGALLDALEVWHQALARDQLAKLSPKFYGGEMIVQQINGILTDYELNRLGAFAGDVHATVMIQDIEDLAAKLMNSDGENRYADALIGQSPSIGLVVDKPALEKMATEFIEGTITFWRKRGYSK